MTLFNKKKLTEKQFGKELEQLRRLIREKVTLFPDDSPAKKAARKAKAEHDELYFIREYLPHYCDEPFAQFHQELVELANEATATDPMAGDAPRGHAKSTIISFGYALHKVVFKAKKFVIEVQETELQSTGITSAMMAELEENPRLKSDFGSLKGTSWTDSDFTTTTGVRVLARGEGQGMRGLKNGPHRPDLIIIDDIESDESVKNPKRIKATVSWILKAVIPSLNPKSGALFMVGTMLAKKSVLAEVKANPKFKTFHYAAIKEDGSPLWQKRFSLDHLQATRELIGIKAWQSEYMNEPQDDQASFEGAWLKNFYDPEILKDKKLTTATYADPSSKSGEHNDFKAVITVSVCPDGIYVRHAWIRKATPDGLVGALYDQKESYDSQVVGSEVNAIGEFLRSALTLKAQERGYPMSLVEITNSSNKIGRIMRLSPLAEHRKIFFIEGHSDQDLLREQLECVPSTTVNDDGPDALEGAVRLAESCVAGPVEYQSISGRRQFEEKGAY